MEVRPTKMLTEKELREDLGISRDTARSQSAS